MLLLTSTVEIHYKKGKENQQNEEKIDQATGTLGGGAMIFQDINEQNRPAINQFIQELWFSTELVIRGKLVDMTVLDGIAVFEENTIIGLLTYEITNEECEIISLDSKCENQGIGSELIKRAVEIARGQGCKKLKLITTNDNINAIKFYQKRGFDLVQLYHNALEVSRRLKPSIPMLGEYGIPLMHEIEFEMLL